MINPDSRSGKRWKKVPEKFGGKEKSSTFAIPFETRVAAAGEPGDRKAKKTSKKFCGIKKSFYLCNPDWERGLEKRAGRLQVQKEIIEKTEGKYKEASTKNKMNESVSFF